MKNPAANSVESSIEKKKSYGLFLFILGVCYPAMIGVRIEPPQGAGYQTPLE
jgi:hypothetical protein